MKVFLGQIVRLFGAITTIILSLSSSTMALEFDSNVPRELRDQVVTDLEFINNVKGERATPLHKEIYGSIQGSDYKAFFENRVFQIGVKECGGNNAVACVIPYLEANKMWITPVYTKFSHPQVARILVLYHEARHTEKKEWNWKHARCPVPFLDENGKDIVSIWSGTKLAGEPACDQTVYGSYGTGVVLLKNLAQGCENCTEKVKMDAQLYATDQLGRLITEEAKKKATDDNL